MLLRRIMSPEEYNIFLSGAKLEKSDDFSQKARSASVGFCFFAPKDVSIPQTVEWLGPLFRAEDVVCTFECDNTSVQKSWGEYAEGLRVTEYCTTQYSAETFRLVGVEPIVKYGKFYSRKEEKHFQALVAERKAWKPHSRT